MDPVIGAALIQVAGKVMVEVLRVPSTPEVMHIPLQGGGKTPAKLPVQAPPAPQAQRISREFLKKTIRECGEQLAATLRQQAEEGEARGTVRSLQAKIQALKSIVDLPEGIKRRHKEQLIITALVPLETELNLSRAVLEDDPDLWRLCYLMGATTLLAAYSYLGVERPTLQADLSAAREEVARRLDELRAVREREHHALLGRVVLARLLRDGEFEWETIPDLLAPGGAEALREAYEEVEEYFEDVSELTVQEIRERLPEISHVSVVERWILEEKRGPDRSTALLAMEARWRQLLREFVADETPDRPVLWLNA